MGKTEQEVKANWSPIKSYNNNKSKPANGGDYIVIGCSNIALALIYGLTYIGDCIKAWEDESTK